MKVRQLVVALLQLDQDAEVYGAPIPIERGHYDRCEYAGPFTGEWRPQGRVVRNVMNLARVEKAVAVLVKD